MNIYPNQEGVPDQFVARIQRDIASTEEKFLSVFAFVMGIVSTITLGLFMVPQVLAIVCGAVSLRSKRMKAFGLAGLILGIIALIVGIAIYIMSFLEY